MGRFLISWVMLVLMPPAMGTPCAPLPERLDFGPFELANPAREARVKLGPDETPEVKKAVADMLAEVEAKTGVKVKYSTWSSPVGGDVFVSTQPWAAKGAWFVKLKNNIIAIHGADFVGTRKAVDAFRARFITPAKGRGDLSWAAIDMKEGPQPDDVFDAELARVTAMREGNRDWENECVTEINRLPARADGFPLARAEDAFSVDEPNTPYVKSLDGRWKFFWNGSPKQRPLDFFRADFDDSDWLEIDVPSCVEMKGFGSPGYVNIIYPHKNDPPFIGDEYNPVSSYRTTFTVPPEWKGRRIILRFNGVYSAYYVWVNGKKVGYAEDSCLPSEFDITEYLNSPTPHSQLPSANYHLSRRRSLSLVGRQLSRRPGLHPVLRHLSRRVDLGGAKEPYPRLFRDDRSVGRSFICGSARQGGLRGAGFGNAVRRGQKASSALQLSTFNPQLSTSNSSSVVGGITVSLYACPDGGRRYPHVQGWREKRPSCAERRNTDKRKVHQVQGGEPS